MKSIVQDGEDQKNFRVWLDNRNMGYNVKITDQSSYAESDFLEHFWAWRTEKGRPLSPKEIKNSLEKYPFMRMGREVNLEPYIPPNSYLRTTQMTPGEFIKRYLPGDNRHRYWFGDEIRRQFLDSAAYWTSDLFTRYEKFALKEVEKRGYMSRSDFIDEYLPDIYGVRNEFNHYLDRMQGTSNAQGLLPAKDIYGGEHIDTKRFFDFRFGEPRFENAFIKHLYKKASKSGLKKDQAYFKGEIQWEYSKFLQERNRANFFKRILHKFQDWIHSFKKSFSRLSGWDKFFFGALSADVALHILH
ncbi:hypothetical protein DFH28DRAFT_942197 [Melampsora americana]|nr:hypothetical protein DFH28DRAFT_942197 [Melampsora americana]